MISIFKCVAVMYSMFLYSHISLASNTENLETFKKVDSKFLRNPKAIQKTARIRIGVKLNPFEKIVVRNKSGKRKISFKKAVVLKNYLRARFDKVNHFYMDEWHVQTRPVAWDKDTKKLSMELSFYKRYGDDRSLEDYVGQVKVDGVAQGSNYIYNFETHKKMVFRNKHGHPILDVEVGPMGLKNPKNIARRKKR